VSEELRARLKSLRPLSTEAALPPVPQPNRVPPPPPVPAGGPQPLVPRGTLGQAAPPPSPAAAVAPASHGATEVAARAQGVPEAWLPEIVGLRPSPVAGEATPTSPPPEPPPAPAARPEPETAPVELAAAPSPAEAAAPAGAETRLAFDLARAPVPRVRPPSRTCPTRRRRGLPTPPRGIDAIAADLARAAFGLLLGLCAGSFVATLARRAPEDWRGLWRGVPRAPAATRSWVPSTSSR
jgi:hypothetical protein